MPLNTETYDALLNYLSWHGSDWRTTAGVVSLPVRKPDTARPTRPVTSFKTACRNVRKKAKVKSRWHENRHTLITDLAESGAGDQTIMDIAGHVSREMLKHYSHIRMEAKRRAVEGIVERCKEHAEADAETPSIWNCFWLPD